MKVKPGGLIVGLITLTAIFFFNIGVGNISEAAGINLPTSIHEILSPEQISKIKSNPAIQEIQRSLRKQSMNEQAVARSSAMMGKGAMNKSVTNAIQEALSKRMQPKIKTEQTEKTDKTGS
jgi:hypothetical protein